MGHSFAATVNCFPLRSRFFLGDPANEQQSPFQRERLGVPVTRLCCYRMVSDNDTRFYTFELTEENKVAWYQSSAD